MTSRTHAHIAAILLSVILWLSNEASSDKDNSSIEDYQTPKDCVAFFTNDKTGVALQCEVDVIDNGTSLAPVPVRYTQSLSITCRWSYTTSLLANLSMAHLIELKEVEFINCQFDYLPSSTFQPLKYSLIYVGFEINSFYTKNQSLLMQNSAIGQIHNLNALSLTGNKMRSTPNNELCGNTQLRYLNLSNNYFDRLSDLGFGEPCSNYSKLQLCGAQLEIMDISFNRLTSLDSNNFCKLQALKYLLLNGNLIAKIDAQAFSGLASLTTLDLSGNQIGDIHVMTFQNLSRLQVLDLSQNNITNLDGVFDGLTSLQVLNMSQNQLVNISPASFKGLINLKELRLSSNKILSVADNAFLDLIMLEQLNLDRNQLNNLTDSTLNGLESLQKITLNDNNIDIMDFNALTKCQKLAEIELENNKLTGVPNFTHMSQLTTINLGQNEITDLTENAFYGLENIIGISLKENKLRKIPETIFKDLKNMLVLNLSNNKLDILSSKTLQFLNKLSHLLLSNNLLTSIPNLQLNKDLIYLDVSTNQITQLDYGMLSSKLLTLLANQNRIKTIDTKFFAAKNIPLVNLDLSNNNINQISATAIPTTLVYLNLDYNKLAEVPLSTFQFSTAIEVVSLKANQLQTFNMGVLRTAVPVGKNRPQFFLSGNPLICDCNLWWINLPNPSSVVETTGVIQDLNYLYCWIPGMGSDSQKQLKLVVEVNGEDLWCEFINYTLPVYVCDTGFCEGICPSQCRCYNSHNWSKTMSFCGGNINTTSIPRGIPISSIVIHLDGNHIETINETSFQQYVQLDTMYLNASHVRNIGAYTFANMSTLKTLNLEQNELRELVSGSFIGLTSLRTLRLFSNQLEKLANDLFVPLVSLVELQLHDNRLTTYPVWNLKSSVNLQRITLSSNPWSCDCDYVTKYREWLQTFADRVVDSETLQCVEVPSLDRSDSATIPLINFNSSVCMEPEMRYVDANLRIIVSVVVVCVALVSVGVLLFAFRLEIQVLIYYRTGVRVRSILPFRDDAEDDADADKLFDAFVAYSSQDDVFVAQELLPGLETGDRPYNLCLHHRNFLVGGVIANSILDAVECSRRTIVVMSENFATSNWCRFEFKSAHLKMMEDRRRRLIMIVVGDIPKDLDDEVKLYLKTNTYLRWGDKLFWQKLYFAMPDRSK